MNIALFLNGTTLLDPKYVEAFSFVSDINSFYTKAKLYIRRLDDIFDKIEIGSLISILFFDDDNDYYYNNNMMVTLKNTKEGDPEINDIIEYTLIHYAYFYDYPVTKAHGISSSDNSGLSLFGVASYIYNRYFVEKFESFNAETTEDQPVIRYQIDEKNADFLMRILKYGYKESLPIYIFSDARNTLNLKCVSSIIGNEPVKYLYAEDTPKEDLKKEALMNLQGVSIKNFKFKINSENTNVSTLNKFTADNFVLADPSKNSKIIKQISLSGNQNTNSHFKSNTPPSIINYGWNITPSDGLSLAIKSTFENALSFSSLSVRTLGIKFFEALPGTYLRVVLPYKNYIDSNTGEISNPSDGDYIVTHSLIGFQKGVWYTDLKLSGVNLRSF